VATTVDQAVALAREHHPELLAVDLLFGATGSEGIALGIDLLKAAPRAEVVFLAQSLDLPEVHAANDLGISRIVPVRELPLYLASSLEPLAELARARRRLDEAQRAVDRLDQGPISPSPSPLPLSIAERRFRESHVRAGLAKAGGRRAAAELLGVPYTTFCVMLRKLGIAPEPNSPP
jgi:DNA-binding NarL/FixJ family response regulator